MASAPTLSLGHTKAPDAFEQDLAILDRYQAYSAEIVRLSLLAIGGIGFLLTKGTEKAAQAVGPLVLINRSTARCVAAAVVCLGVAAAAALAHRFVSADSMAYHLSMLRLELHGRVDSAEREKHKRKQRLAASGWLLTIAAAMLAIGAGLLAAAFVNALTPLLT